MKLSAQHIRIASATLLLCAAALLVSTNPAVAAASDYFDTANIFRGIGLSTSSPTELALNLLAAFLGLIGLIDVCIIVYGGFSIMTSSGNPEKVKSGRDTVVWAIVGSIIIFSALGIVVYLGNIIAP